MCKISICILPLFTQFPHYLLCKIHRGFLRNNIFVHFNLCTGTIHHTLSKCTCFCISLYPFAVIRIIFLLYLPMGNFGGIFFLSERCGRPFSLRRLLIYFLSDGCWSIFSQMDADLISLRRMLILFLSDVCCIYFLSDGCWSIFSQQNADLLSLRRLLETIFFQKDAELFSLRRLLETIFFQNLVRLNLVL